MKSIRKKLAASFLIAGVLVSLVSANTAYADTITDEDEIEVVEDVKEVVVLCQENGQVKCS
ncbi:MULTISPECIES: hypothetical protein [unclassified Breznakia]|uniref:hypothetical protein n=1 Tax=unclassified Breznakia TaxID=2623764 RepID=UPI002406C6A9|nr:MULTISPECIES: hypothetical protein [unclassified Breznakia]MDF9837051.1 CHASE3 domain sensor protein [Breznakia sp. PFB2-8]MDF9858976.1 CHASE3 domain sensor protein [Breznakia sp. PH5-24]